MSSKKSQWIRDKIANKWERTPAWSLEKLNWFLDGCKPRPTTLHTDAYWGERDDYGYCDERAINAYDMLENYNVW